MAPCVLAHQQITTDPTRHTRRASVGQICFSGKYVPMKAAAWALSPTAERAGGANADAEDAAKGAAKGRPKRLDRVFLRSERCTAAQIRSVLNGRRKANGSARAAHANGGTPRDDGALVRETTLIFLQLSPRPSPRPSPGMALRVRTSAGAQCSPRWQNAAGGRHGVQALRRRGVRMAAPLTESLRCDGSRGRASSVAATWGTPRGGCGLVDGWAGQSALGAEGTAR